jgi:citrate synthase
MFTALFATARVVGWTAHVIEYVNDNKLIRPTSEYVGPMNAEYIPFERRDENG